MRSVAILADADAAPLPKSKRHLILSSENFSPKRLGKCNLLATFSRHLKFVNMLSRVLSSPLSLLLLPRNWQKVPRFIATAATTTANNIWQRGGAAGEQASSFAPAPTAFYWTLILAPFPSQITQNVIATIKFSRIVYLQINNITASVAKQGRKTRCPLSLFRIAKSDV